MSLAVTPQQAVAHRLATHNLVTRLAPGDYVRAARYAIQDTGPRDGLISLHARVAECEPSAWEAPDLVQVYSPRMAVHIIPLADLAVFTVGRLPLDPGRRREIQRTADDICKVLDGREVRQVQLPGLREASASGRIAVRWTTSALHVREIVAPEVDPQQARVELCRRHIHAFGPTTPTAFAWWAGITPADGRRTWTLVDDELVPVTVGQTDAWLLAEDEDALRRAGPALGTRFLPASDLRLLGQDRTRTLVGPGQWQRPPRSDWFHPHGLLHDGRVIGAWGRRGGRIHVRVPAPVADDVLAAAEAEAATMPIPGYGTTLEVMVT